MGIAGDSSDPDDPADELQIGPDLEVALTQSLRAWLDERGLYGEERLCALGRAFLREALHSYDEAERDHQLFDLLIEKEQRQEQRGTGPAYITLHAIAPILMDRENGYDIQRHFGRWP